MSDVFSRIERSPCLNDSRVRIRSVVRLVAFSKFGRESAELTRELAEPPFANARLRALERREEALVGERLQHVVDRVHVEGVRRVTAEGGDEHDDRSVLRRAFRELEAGGFWHLDVEKRDVESLPRERVSDLAARPRTRRPTAISASRFRRSATIARASGSSSATSTRKRLTRLRGCRRLRGVAGSVSSTTVPAPSFGRTVSVASRP